MSMTDLVADMLTRIRNAIHSRRKEALVRYSSLNHRVARLLKEEGYVNDVSIVKEAGRSVIKIQLKYTPSKKNAITNITRVSKPGLRKYAGSAEIPKVLNGLGISIVSTSKGVITDKSARELGVGGELICTVY